MKQHLLTRRKTKAVTIFVVAFVVILTAPGIQLTQAADGTVGNINVSATSHVSGAVISIRMFSLTVSADYMLNWTGDDTGISFTTAATQTDFQKQLALSSSLALVTFFLREQSTGTIIDQVSVNMIQITDFLATALIISAGIFVLLIAIFRRISKG